MGDGEVGHWIMWRGRPELSGGLAPAAGAAMEGTGSAECGGGGGGSDETGGGGCCVSPIHAACRAMMLRLICAMLVDISATTAARDSRVRGTAAEDPAAASAGAPTAADRVMDEDDVSSGRVVVGGIGGAAAAVVEAMIGEAPIPDCYGRCWDREERVEGAAAELQYPRATVPARVLFI
jgi:hypothetical protein